MILYLAWVNGLRGPEPQLWHKEKPGDAFVTPSDLPVIDKPMRLPAEITTLDAAVRWSKAA